MERSEGDCRWTRDPQLSARDRARIRHRPPYPAPAPGALGLLVVMGRALVAGGQEWRKRRDRRMHLRLLVRMHGLLPLRRRVRTGFPRRRTVPRKIRASAAL